MNSVLNGRLFDHHVILSPEKKQNIWASVLTVSDVKCTLDYFCMSGLCEADGNDVQDFCGNKLSFHHVGLM